MRYRTCLPGLILSIGAFLAVSPTADASAPTCIPPIEIPLTGKSCDPLRPPEISCRAWADVEGGLKQTNYNTVQRAADIFSWQTFLALNWPAASEKRGEPNQNASITDTEPPRVWETWKEAFEVYLPDGSQPLPWNKWTPLPEAAAAACGELDKHKHLTRDTKVSDLVDSIYQALPADGTLPATLRDQQGRLLRYEVRLNKKLFDYITKSRLYNGDEQARAEKIEFPIGSRLIKAAWRQVEGDEKPFFHVTEACVCDKSVTGVLTDCGIKTMGLAGFHIMTKTESAPQWIWSTFEQVDNVVTIHDEVSPLNDPDCPPDRCPPNKQTKNFMPNQVRRVVPIPAQEPDCSRPDQAVDNVAQLNQDVWKALGELGSPLQYYQLVGTQWPSPPAVPGTMVHVMPALLANTTMETFGQNTSSCMGCHTMSRTLNPSTFVSADFSFTLNNAQPRPVGARCRDVEASESCSDSILQAPPEQPKTVSDPDIRAGFEAATRTYEIVGPRFVGSKLHCSSCHLNAGGNPAAAWWVDMQKEYSYPATSRLPKRINGCFERSMNGEAICSTADGPEDCANNPVMRSLIAYMGWLTDQFHARYPNRRPGRGFPPLNAGVAVGVAVGVADADYHRGRRTYTQKCSFCHNASGQGRYESDTYFRPALWGPDSFNACAGMAKKEKLAQFLLWNMPYTSGGMLTPLEARDIATYIDAQCRPGKGGIGPSGEPCSLSPSCVDGGPARTSAPEQKRTETSQLKAMHRKP